MRGGEQLPSGDLVEGIYAAALEPQRWPAVLRDLACSVGAPGAVLQVQATGSGEVLFAATGGLDESALAEYARHWVRFDPRVGVGLSRPVGEILIPEEHLGVAAFRRTAIYNDFLRPLELGATLGGIVHADREIFVAASAQRSLRPPGFRERDRRRFVAMAPHLARAARIGHELGAAAAARQALTDALDRLPRGVLLLDTRLAVKFANTYAEEVLAAGDGLLLDRAGLQAAHPADSAVLRALVAGAAHPAAGGPRAAGGYLAVRRPSLRRPLELLVTPLTPELATVAPGRAVAAVFLVDPERRLELPHEALRQLYGLTPAEARLASLLAEGIGLPEAAEQLGITRETAKSTLHLIFAKTDTRRQAELVRRLLTGPGACTSLRPSPRTGDAGRPDRCEYPCRTGGGA